MEDLEQRASRESLKEKYRLYVVEKRDSGVRLDRWFHRHFPHLTQGQLQKSLRLGDIRVDGKKGRTSQRLHEKQTLALFQGLLSQELLSQGLLGQKAQMEGNAFGKTPPPHVLKELERLQKAILYHDEEVLILNKPSGLATQGGTGLSSHVDSLLSLFLTQRRGKERQKHHLVHRLDRDTSGVLLVALSPDVAAFLGEAFRLRRVKKIYWALVVGVPPLVAGEISLSLQKRPGRLGEKMDVVSPEAEEGKASLTTYRVIRAAKDRTWSWLELIPHTGRTHQLRAHCAALGCPIMGDGKYGGSNARPLGRTCLHLHARSLQFPTPSKGAQIVTAPLPPHMEATWKALGLLEDD